MTPHLGGYTYASMKRVVEGAAIDLLGNLRA
jgi:phosphoglycerate dehydrogenase-like enzyme